MILSKEDIRKKYDSYSKYYDLIEAIGEVFFHKYRKRLISNLKGDILEVGIGTGKNLKYYDKSSKITGIDISEGMLERAKRKSKNVNLILADSENLPFQNNSFDYVVDTFCLCTYPHPLNVLDEMKRVLRKNGRVILLEHGISNNNFLIKSQKSRSEKHYNRTGCNLTRNHVDLINKSGLKIIEQKRKFFGILYIIEATK